MKMLPTILHILTQPYFLYPALVVFVIWAVSTNLKRRR